MRLEPTSYAEKAESLRPNQVAVLTMSSLGRPARPTTMQSSPTRSRLYEVVVRTRATPSRLPVLDETSAVAWALQWAVCDLSISNDQYRRLRYQAHMLLSATRSPSSSG